jgi:integral membrane protein
MSTFRDTPEVGEYLTELDPRNRLIRKAKFTQFMALVETVSYACLLVPMFRKYALDDVSNANYVALRMIAYFHGIFAIAFAVMVFDIRRPLKWSWPFFALTLAGPPGAIIAAYRLRRDPIPQEVHMKDMYF